MNILNIASGFSSLGDKGDSGIDGSIGISTYVYDGIIQNNEYFIKNCILTNKSFNDVNSNIPGYPIRKYNTGDLIIDANYKYYKINLNLDKKYEDYGQTTSGNFHKLYVDASFLRIANIIDNTSKFTTDNIFSNTPNIKTTYDTISSASNCYDIAPLNYATIRYSDYTIGNYISFIEYTGGNQLNKDNDSFGIVKNSYIPKWNIGILNNNNLTNTHFKFDFDKLLFNVNDTSILGNTHIKDVSVYNIEDYATTTMYGTVNVINSCGINDVVYFNNNVYFNKAKINNNSVLTLDTAGDVSAWAYLNSFNSDFETDIIINNSSTNTVIYPLHVVELSDEYMYNKNAFSYVDSSLVDYTINWSGSNPPTPPYTADEFYINSLKFSLSSLNTSITPKIIFFNFDLDVSVSAELTSIANANYYTFYFDASIYGNYNKIINSFSDQYFPLYMSRNNTNVRATDIYLKLSYDTNDSSRKRIKADVIPILSEYGNHLLHDCPTIKFNTSGFFKIG